MTSTTRGTLRPNRILLVLALLALGLLAWVNLGPGSVWAQTPTPTATPLPALLSISVSEGNPNITSVTVTGTQYPANTSVAVTYDGANVATKSTGASGNWSTTFTIPPSTNGTHVIAAGGATVNFTVLPTARLSTNRGSLGTRITVTGDGFGSGQSGIFVELNGEVVASGIANQQGSFTTSFNVPRVPAGSYSINIANVTSADFTVTSTFSISPESGPPGTPVAVIGSGFDSNASVSVRLDGKTVQSVTTTGDGQLSATVQIPQVAGGTKILSISGSASGSAQASFNVTPTFVSDRPNASPGTSVGVSGSGFGANESGITVKFDGTPVVSGLSADAQGRWSGSFSVPSATAGNHALRASGFLTSESSVSQVSLTVGAGIDLERTSGPPGSIIQVSGSGVGPREPITVTVGDNLFTTSVVADNRGEWQTDLTIPAAPRSSLPIRAKGVNSQEAVTNFNVTSSLTISEQTATPGTTITVRGEGFGANQSSIAVRFNEAIVASATASSQGSWSSSFVVPAAPKGNYTVSVDTGNTELQEPLSVTPGLTLSKTQASPGETNSISGSGFAANERDIKVTLGETILAPGITANADGSWNSSFTVPVLPSGSYELSASGAQTSVSSVRGEVLTLGLGIILDKTSGPPGTSVSLSGRGFNAREGEIQVLYDGTPVVSAIVANQMGSFSVVFDVPSSASGTHAIEISRTTGAPGVATSVNFQVLPYISVEDPEGSPGATVTVKGMGFNANERNIVLSYDGDPLAERANAGEDGSFTAEITIPDSPTGDHLIQAAGPVSASAGRPEQSFEVVPALTLSDTTGALGQQVEITGKGFAPESLVSVAYDGDSDVSVITGPSGSFQLSFTVPKSASGDHMLLISDEGGNRKQVKFAVEEDPPPAPSLLTPENRNKGGLFGGYRPAPRWSEVEDASGVTYTLMIARDPDFFDVVLEKPGLTRPSYALNEIEALPRGKYYWRVNATDEASNVGPWSDTYTIDSGIVPLWVVPALVVLGILAVGSTGYKFVYQPWRQRQLMGVPDYVRIARPETGAATALPTPPPASRTLTAPPRRALPSPFRRGRSLSPEDLARLQMVIDFMQSLPLIEVTPDLAWLEELVEELGGNKEDMYALILLGQQELAYQPAWMQHPTYEELQQTPQAREFLHSLDEYVNAVNECAADSVSLIRQVYGSLLTSNPPEDVEDSQWQLVMSVVVGTLSWFRGTFLAQPSARDYVVRPASDSAEEVMYSLHGAERTPFAYPLVEGVSESDAVFYRDLHIQLRTFYRTNDEARLLAAKMASSSALRNQLSQTIAAMGQNLPGNQ